MDFIKEAEASHSRITCKTVRSILYECAAECLRQMVMARTKENNRSKTSQEEEAAELPKIQITQGDIDLSYGMARKIGRRWVDKLIMTDDDSNMEVSAIVNLVLGNGEFLDLSYRDDLDQLETTAGGRYGIGRASQQPLHQDVNGAENDARDQSLDDDDSSDIPTAGQTQDDNDDSQQQEEGSGSDPTGLESLSNIKQSIPYATLLKIGQLDHCNLFASDDCQQGTSEDWHPLPTLPSTTTTSSLVHIPNPTIMPQEQIQKIDKEQLFGRPALKMPPKLDCKEQISIIDDLAYETGDVGNRELGHTLWPFGWDMIQKQVERNHDRLHPTKAKYGLTTNEEGEEQLREVIPRSLLQDRSTGEINGLEDDIDVNGNATRDNLNDSASVDDEPLFVTTGDSGNVERVSISKGFRSTWTSKKFTRRKDSDGEDARDTNVRDTTGDNNAQKSSTESNPTMNQRRVIAKKPSAFGDFQWTSQAIRNSLGQDLREKLERTMIHGNDDSQRELHTCQGALKAIGNVHLFEQIISKKWEGVIDDIPHGEEDEGSGQVGKEQMKVRKVAHRLAKRQRLYPNYELGTKGYRDQLKSKVMRGWEGKEGCRAPRNRDDNECIGNNSLELDLGECIFTIVTSSKDVDAAPIKKVLAFRSLEVSLLEPSLY
eukprot:scaffold164_cov266-Chaetoceros_neogracile.AAC.38